MDDPHFTIPSQTYTLVNVFQRAHQSAPLPLLPHSHTSPHLSWYWMSSNELCTLATSWLNAGMERRSAASTDLREGEGKWEGVSRGGEYEGNGVRRGWALLTAECIDREGDERQAEGDRHS